MQFIECYNLLAEASLSLLTQKYKFLEGRQIINPLTSQQGEYVSQSDDLVAWKSNVLD